MSEPAGGRRADETPREAEERYRGLFELAPVMYVVTRAVDDEGVVVDCNRLFLSTLGYEREEVVGRPLADFYAPGFRERLRGGGYLRSMREGVVGEERELLARGGRTVHTLLGALPEIGPDGEPVGTRAVYIDVSERKRAADDLVERERFLRAVIDSEPECVKVIAPDGTLLDINPAGLAMVEADSPKQVLGLPIAGLVAPEHRDAFLALVARCLLGEPGHLEFEIVGLKGARRWMETRSTPLRDAGGVVMGILQITRDVTERRRAEEALREAEERFRTLAEQIPAVTYIDVADTSGTTLFVSPQVESALGIPREEWLARGADLWIDLIHPDDRERVMAEYEAAVDRRDSFRAEYRVVTRDGRVRWLDDRFVVLPDPAGGPGFLHGVMFDVTEAREAERALRESEELVRRLFARLVTAQEEERKRIAADIHDDSIQIVTAVGLRLQTLRRSLSEPEAIEAIRKAEETVEAAIGRLRRLLFDLRPRVLDEEGLAAALRTYLDHFRSSTWIECTLRNELVDEPSLEMRTVLYRIAQEALGNVRKHADASRVDVLLEALDGGVRLLVRDDGLGFESSDGSAPGHLGLESMRERAELAGGWLRVDSAPGRGTDVEVWVPAEPRP